MRRPSPCRPATGSPRATTWPSRCAISRRASASTLDGATIDAASTPSRAATSSRCASIEAGEPVRKYGQVIGRATAAIARGAHVHTHNLATQLAGVDEYRFAPRSRNAPTLAVPNR